MGRYPAVDLLVLALRGLPPLPKALCRNRAALFDSEDPAGVAEAVGLCHRCPELGTCRSWVERLDYRHRPTGVVAGRHYRRRNKRTQLVS